MAEEISVITDPNEPTVLAGARRRQSGNWVAWLAALLLTAGVGIGFAYLLLGQQHRRPALIVLGATAVACVLWLALGAWLWRHLVWVKRAGQLYVTTLAIVAACAFFFFLIHWRQTAIALAGFWGMMLMFIVGLWLIRLILSPGVPMLGVARTFVDEAIRMKIAIVFIVCLTLLVPFLPLIQDPLERLQYRIQFFLYWTLAGTGFLLSLMTIFLACGTICNEIKHHQIFLTMTKPVSRFQYLAGKWLGLVLLNLLLVSVAGVGVFAGVHLLSEEPAQDRFDLLALNTEVLVARQGETPTNKENLNSDQIFAKHLKDLRDANQTDSNKIIAGPPTPAEETAVKAWMAANWYAVAPREEMSYTFHNLLPAKRFNDWMQLRVKATMSPDPPNHKLYIGLTLNGQVFPLNQQGQRLPLEVLSNQYDIINIPVRFIDDKGDLELRVANPMANTIDFQAGNGLEILYRTGDFLPNLVRGLSIVWLKLVFLAMLGLTAGTFLGFAVASLTGIVVFILANFSGFITESLSSFGNSATDAQSAAWARVPLGTLLGRISRGEFSSALAYVVAGVDKLMMGVFSAFGSYAPVGLLVDGRLIPSTMVVSAAVWLILVWTLGCGLVGLAIFWRRELARVIV